MISIIFCDTVCSFLPHFCNCAHKASDDTLQPAPYANINDMGCKVRFDATQSWNKGFISMNKGFSYRNKGFIFANKSFILRFHRHKRHFAQARDTLCIGTEDG